VIATHNTFAGSGPRKSNILTQLQIRGYHALIRDVEHSSSSHQAFSTHSQRDGFLGLIPAPQTQPTPVLLPQLLGNGVVHSKKRFIHRLLGSEPWLYVWLRTGFSSGNREAMFVN